MLRRVLWLGWLGILGGCGLLGGGPTEPEQCEQAAPAVVPLFAPGPSETGPIVVRRPDGVIVTTASGRVRPRHEREDRFMHFEGHYFEHRSFRFTIEDHVAAGASSIKVIYEPIADPSTYGPTTNFRAWKMYGPAGNGPQSYTFADNGVLTQVAPRRLEKTVTRNARESRPIKVGDIFDFEFGIFLAGFDAADPSSIGDGAKSYYSDTFRYQVGVGGLTPETFDTTGLLGPVESARLGGGLTVPHIAFANGTPVGPEMAFSQLALNTQSPHQQLALEGRRLFHTRFDTGGHSEPYNPIFSEQAGKLGPHFNTTSCSACHVHNGRGTLPAPGGAPVESLVLKLYGDDAYGSQLQPQEAPLRLVRYETRQVTLGDGQVVTLKKPVFDAGRSLHASPRLARQLVGMGLLEAIDESTILARADEHDCDGNGISGRAQQVKDPVTGELRLGRFGWKAEKVSVRHQVADALDADLGVTTSIFPRNGAAELSDDDLQRLTVYMQLLGVLPQRNATDPKVERGAELFASIGCAGCHVTATLTGDSHPFEELRAQRVRPFTDMLLHDMGPDLADDSGRPEASEWRTAPLWGVGFTREVSGSVHLLHDGRAGSVLEAILWHGGEAKPMRDTVVALSKDSREALIAYLESL
ncbi:di-heme oxidoredictase family protein [Archangium violaceum]|uniref:di-heme oxidoredictase family protein n=1 Tax=Archangium violaceum TaxID=83451 RepID=UPI002B2877AA|nr:di-heme oxidoredictase family protein [Archangium gephyra]